MFPFMYKLSGNYAEAHLNVMILCVKSKIVAEHLGDKLKLIQPQEDE